MDIIKGGICAPKGFKANGIYCGISESSDKKDLALIVSDVVGSAACIYTPNQVRSAPLKVTAENLKNGRAQAIICNGYNANALTADGVRDAERICELVEDSVKVRSDDVIIASFGKIGEKIDVKLIELGMFSLSNNLSYTSNKLVAETIAQGDTQVKEISVSFELGKAKCKIGAVGKGIGTNAFGIPVKLIFVTSDVDIDEDLLSGALSHAAQTSFNMISYDGNSSPNDMCAIISNGLAENEKICHHNRDYAIFRDALCFVMTEISRMIAHEGKGVTRTVECNVTEARGTLSAQKIARGVVGDLAVKTSLIGNKVDVGAIICAIGNSCTDFDVNKIGVCLESEGGVIQIFKDGAVADYSKEKAVEIFSGDEIKINVSLCEGKYSATAWGTDLI